MDEEIKDSRKELEREYNEKLEEITFRQRTVDQTADSMAEEGVYWLKKINPEASSREIYQIVDDYRNQAREAIGQERRKITNQYEENRDELNRKLRDQDGDIR
ncbi:hypothetical protein [Xylocopilactobacillus apicola]|uniref:Uncharacterized protein n=1 Tax=Xylocopilactobacillus apicola TaxID=2932184 RepID=A0AAU9D3M8_9LACO|nr:hypothetical protein [Xylocopilactobacillus apicola]BDR59436.1 hypothetical protein XA3_18770 [Xylocopilactobacillus apicola]